MISGQLMPHNLLQWSSREKQHMHDQATRMRHIAGIYAQAARAPKPFVITVTSGKGGVGKSTVALNTAMILADLGVKVVLLDADANLSGLDIMSGVTPRFRLGHVLRAECDVEDALVTLGTGIRLLAGSSGELDYPQLGTDAQRDLVGGVIGMDDPVDVVMIDTAAGLTPEIVQYTEEADTVLVVTAPEPTAVMDAYALIKVISLGGIVQPVNVVVNGVRTPREGEETFEKLQAAVRHFLQREIGCAGCIPRDERVSEAIRNQEPLVRRYPRSAAALSINVLARSLLTTTIHESVKMSVAL
jgi:flagellar biosynthesis protein FlhG